MQPALATFDLGSKSILFLSPWPSLGEQVDQFEFD